MLSSASLATKIIAYKKRLILTPNTSPITKPNINPPKVIIYIKKHISICKK